MSQSVEIILVRHGESVRNLSCDMAREGDPDWLVRQMRDEQEETAWPLTPLGHEQAAAAGHWIRQNIGTDFDASYVSPFLRAQETANGLGLGLGWTLDERIREREWGDYCAPGYPEYTVENYLSDLHVCGDLNWKSLYPGAESVRDMVPRVSDFISTALNANSLGRIIAVTHGGTIRAMQVVLEQIGPGETLCTDRRLSNCCVVMYRLEEVDLDRLAWRGEVRTAHPALPGSPETAWQPIDGAVNRAS